MCAEQVRRADKTDQRAWSELVAASPGGTLYQTPEWCDFVTAVFGHLPAHLVVERDGNLSGVLPLFRVRTPWSRAKLLSLPYDASSGGPVSRDDDSAAALVREAMQIARAQKVNSLELRMARPVPALEGLGLARSELVINSVVPLSSHDQAWKRVSPDNRQSIRKAARRGVTVRPAASVEDYLAFYDIYLRVFKAFGTPPYSRRYFTELHRRFQGSGASRVLLASVEGRVVGGLLAYTFGRGVVSKFCVALEEAVPLRVYPALYGACIDLSLDLGAEWLSWGSSSRSQAGLIDFKHRWGAEAETAVRYALAVSGSPPDLERYYDTDGLERRVWRRLPLPVTAILGGPLSRWFC
jgi:hypothetical protein